MNQKKKIEATLRLLMVSQVRKAAWLWRSSVLLLTVTQGQGGAVLRLVVSLGWVGW